MHVCYVPSTYIDPKEASNGSTTSDLTPSNQNRAVPERKSPLRVRHQVDHAHAGPLGEPDPHPDGA